MHAFGKTIYRGAEFGSGDWRWGEFLRTQLDGHET